MKYYNSRYWFYSGFSIFLAFLFGFRDIWILLYGKWPHLYAVINTPRASWEGIFAYFPFTNHVTLSNLLPAAPMANTGLSNFNYFPPITIISQGIIFKWFFFSNIDLYMLFMHTVFPVASFWLIFEIFKRYITPAWALMLAFWGVTFFPNFSLFSYLLNLVKDPSGYITTASLSPMELTRTPIPSFSFFIFILSFYLTIKEHRPSRSRYFLLSTLWALNLYVYLFNFVAGVLFWVLYMIYTCYIRDRGFKYRDIAVTLFPNIVIILAVISPVIIKRVFLATPLDQEIFERMELIGYEAGFIANDWGLLFSYLLPIIAVLIVLWLYCADYYELAYKFSPVFIMIFVEIVVSNLHLVLGKFFQPDLYFMRIGSYFPRYLYFIPIIYFLSLPNKRLFHNKFRNRISEVLHTICDRVIIRPQAVIAFMGIFVLTLFSIFSGIRYIRHYEKSVAPRMTMIEESYNNLASVTNGSDGIIVSDDIPVNLLIPVMSKQETLLVSAFSNFTSSEEILDRLVLFTRIFNWDKEQFLDFMMPSERYHDFNSDNNFTLSDETLAKGFGYWLMNHRRHMNSEELEKYRERILRVYETYDLDLNIRKYKVRAVQATGSINPVLSVKSALKGDKNTVYILKET